MIRAALVGAAHWHVPLMARGFAPAGIALSGIWDPDPGRARSLAAAHDAPVYASLDALLEAGRHDCAFVSGPHRELPGLARAVLARKLPMSLEKPCGRTANEVAALEAEAREAGVPVAVPLVQRHAELGRRLLAVARDDPPLEFAVRFVAGPPERYLRSDNAWMLDPEASGGGAAINLAVHFVDLAIELTGSPVVEVFASTSAARHRRAVEDLAVLTLGHGNGAVSNLVVGYRFPETPPWRDFRVTMAGRRTWVVTDDAGLLVRDERGQATHVPASVDTDAYYADYVRHFAHDLRQRHAPVTGLADMARALAVIDAAYRSDRERRSVRVVPPA
ncbi:MAG TPA: Gfo/Idh/MocA family oxidoreductase [Casimicrobiaceae bacterium]|nr:Gfo/Idh/MocA family oxidoreductase [Casimicrobiaceae bacterium]